MQNSWWHSLGHHYPEVDLIVKLSEYLKDLHNIHMDMNSRHFNAQFEFGYSDSDRRHSMAKFNDSKWEFKKIDKQSMEITNCCVLHTALD